MDQDALEVRERFVEERIERADAAGMVVVEDIYQPESLDRMPVLGDVEDRPALIRQDDLGISADDVHLGEYKYSRGGNYLDEVGGQPEHLGAGGAGILGDVGQLRGMVAILEQIGQRDKGRGRPEGGRQQRGEGGGLHLVVQVVQVFQGREPLLRETGRARVLSEVDAVELAGDREGDVFEVPRGELGSDRAYRLSGDAVIWEMSLNRTPAVLSAST